MTTIGDHYNELNKKHASAGNNLAVIESLVPEYEMLLNAAPNEPVFLFSLGTAKLQLGLNGSAINYFERALEHGLDVPEVWNNLGSAWKAENRNDKARENWLEALKRREHADYYNNMATLSVNEGAPREGIEWAEKGIALDPNHARLHWNYALLLLESGRWREGFAEYDWGLASNDRPVRHYSEDPNAVPFWQHGQRGRVVLYGEQGMGDEIMFAQCIPDLVRAVGAENVIYDCHPRMINLFRRSFADGITYYPTRKELELTWPRNERLDYKLASGSLFTRFAPTGNFRREPYLKADPERVAHYRARLRELGDGPYVGLGWQAGVKKTNHHYRSLKLKFFLPILEQGGTFVSLQYTEGSAGKCQRFEADTGYRVTHWPDVVEAGPGEQRYSGFDYDETAALVSALDLCILPNTTAVHLCGALGANCWTVTPSAMAWRYQLTGEHMAMYGDWVRQFRDWGTLPQAYGAWLQS